MVILPGKAETEKAQFAMGKIMKDHSSLGPEAYDIDLDNKFLEEQDRHIQVEARKALPLNLFSEGVLELETDELAQNIRIKLWKSYQRRPISRPKAYIKAIAHTTAVDMVRNHKPTLSLTSDVNEELCLGDLLVAHNEGFQDPAYEIEFVEIDPSLLTKLVEAILALPPRQKQAMLHALRDCKDDILPLINALKTRGIDIVAMDWPEEEREVYLLKASLSVARKKLKWLLAEFM